MKDINYLAIIVGVVTDVGSTQVILIKFIFLCAFLNRIEGIHMRDLLINPPLSIRLPELALGSLGTLLGGFVAGRMAKKAEILNTLLMGLVSNTTALFFPAKVPTWFLVAGVFLTFASAVLGGCLARLIRYEDEHASTPQLRR